MCDKYPAVIDILFVMQLILNILRKAAIKTAPIFFADNHFSVDDFNTRLNLQHFRPQHFQTGTAAAFI